MIELLGRLSPSLSPHRTMKLANGRSRSIASVGRLLFLTLHPVLSFHSLDSRRWCSMPSTPKSVLRSQELESSIREAWQVGETDGILKLASEIEFERFDVQDLVFSTLDAIPIKGQAAGALNTWIGSCIQLNDLEAGADRAWQLLGIYDSLKEFEPDIVALSLAYTAMTRPEVPEKYHSLGNSVLDRAKRLAKKQGGSKRRKSLAASSRKQIGNRRDELFELYGVQLLHESDHELIVNKPSGMVCAHKSTTSSGKLTASRRKHQRDGTSSIDLDISLEAALMDLGIPLSTINVDGRGLVHRIDRGTSGCIILAKTDERHAQLVSDFFLRNIKKDYQAFVTLPMHDIPDSGTIDVPVHGRPAVSSYTVEERLGSKIALLRVQTMTGRKHQVRVHCAEALQAPIVGDTKYVSGDPVPNTGKSGLKERFCLHAASLLVPGIAQIEAPLPTWWEETFSEHDLSHTRPP